MNVAALYKKAMENTKFVLTVTELRSVVEQFCNLQNGKSAVAEIDGDCIIIGDIHGMISDLQQYFYDFDEKNIVLLGDYVDRGQSSYECIVLVILRMLMYPERTVALRGNHETKEMSLMQLTGMTLLSDITVKYRPEEYEEVRQLFIWLFDYMNIYAVVNNTFLCVHGCIPSFVDYFSDLTALQLPCTIPQSYAYGNYSGILQYMSLWADPVQDEKELSLSNKEVILYKQRRETISLNQRRDESGELVYYKDVSRRLDQFKFKALFKGHIQVTGMDLTLDGRIITLQGHQYGYSQSIVFTGAVCVEVQMNNDLILHQY